MSGSRSLEASVTAGSVQSFAPVSICTGDTRLIIDPFNPRCTPPGSLWRRLETAVFGCAHGDVYREGVQELDAVACVLRIG
eukprot:3932962-Prymnesium_polylepis.1